MGNDFSPFILEDLYNQYEPEMVLDLSSASMPAMSLNDLLGYYDEAVVGHCEEHSKSATKQSIVNELLNTKLSYSTQYGSELVRKKICGLYNSHCKPQNILLTSGASEAIFLVMSTMFEAGGTIIVQQPIYQSLHQVATDRGVRVIDWDLPWDLNKLADLIKKHPQAKALVINNPNNPTGLGFKRKELKQIGEILDGRYLISDEVFLFISQSQLPSALEVYENSIVISDLSKSFNMPGLRLGWIAVSSQNLLEQFSGLKNYLSLRTNTLSEAIAPWVLGKHQEISDKNRCVIKSNIEHLYSLDPESLFFDLSGIPAQNIEGLCIFPRIKDETFIDKLWSEKKIFVAKGLNFGEKWGKYLRVGLKDKLLIT